MSTRYNWNLGWTMTKTIARHRQKGRSLQPGEETMLARHATRVDPIAAVATADKLNKLWLRTSKCVSLNYVPTGFRARAKTLPQATLVRA